MSDRVTLPNVRKIFIPDPGWVMFDCDLSGADAQVVAWEAGDEDLKNAFRAGLDVHSKNCEDMHGAAFTRLSSDDPKRYKLRQEMKRGVHATNYGGHFKTLATKLGWTVHEAEQFQKRWLSLHPKIGPQSRPGSWHHKVMTNLLATKSVANAFGYRRIYFDRPDSVFTEALAWTPQSTVALVSFYGALKLEAACPWVQILLQNHDSLVFQVLKEHSTRYKEILDNLRIEVPYPDPLYIPWGVAKSETSWGDCKKLKKEELA